ncbi:MAG: SDR family oxidoreductase [Pyrinomonadaceae bacterium]|nr:SDR family oxidoreductase [Pyrinomonadaceae bacterium]
MKATLITGASGGIGEAFARRLAAEKHNLVLVARSEDKLHELCDELMLKHQITAHYVAIDLIDYEADRRLYEETEKHDLEIEWLINNAGFGSMGDFANLELENEMEMISLNIMALVALTHRYLQQMRTRKSGVIINVASTAGFQPIPFMATYAATKAFVTSFSEAISEENRPHNIIVTALCPGPTDTKFFDVAGAEAFKLKGMQTPEQVVEAALNGVKSGKASVVSGWKNYIGAVVGMFAPNFLVTRTIAKVLRPKVENKQ